MKTKCCLTTNLILLSIITIAQTNLTSYKGGDKELVRFLGKNIVYQELELKEGRSTIVFAKILFKKNGYIDSFKLSINNDSPIGKEILLSLNKSKNNWLKFKKSIPIIIPFVFIDDSNLPLNSRCLNIQNALPNYNFFNLKTIILNPLVFYRNNDIYHKNK